MYTLKVYKKPYSKEPVKEEISFSESFDTMTELMPSFRKICNNYPSYLYEISADEEGKSRTIIYGPTDINDEKYLLNEDTNSCLHKFYTDNTDQDDSAELIKNSISHIGDRRRQTKKEYMVCRCGTNYLFKRPRKYKCLFCGQELKKIQTVDEFEEQNIRSWAGANIYDEESYKMRKESY